MLNKPDALWLNTSPSLQCFAQPLLCYLSRTVTMRQWEYCQSQDEASSLDVALLLLHDYLKSCNQPVHLIGHSTGGLLGLLYARRYPETVKTLTLLAVGVDAAVQRSSMPLGGVPVPLMVCGSFDDIIVAPDALQGWQPWLKEGDHLWSCLEGRHFFHYFQPTLVGKQILNFWKSLRQLDSLRSSIETLSRIFLL